MARINGVEVKAVKYRAGHDGARVASGSIYVDGKKLGRWSQDAWGGPDDFGDFYGAIEERARRFKDAWPSDDRFFGVQDSPDVFIGHVLKLNGIDGQYDFDGGHPVPGWLVDWFEGKEI